MAGEPVAWSITFLGCSPAQPECDAGHFEVTPPQGAAVTIEVRTTAQIEGILARELGKEALDAADREAILSVAGRQLIDECLARGEEPGPVLRLDSRLFRSPGAERRLLRECGLLAA